MSSYIYLLIEREFLKTNEKIYKIGKTRQTNLQRFNQYPKGSKLLLSLDCKNCDIMEKNVIELFKKKYIHRVDYGSEYFEGDENKMVIDIMNLILNEKNENITTTTTQCTKKDKNLNKKKKKDYDLVDLNSLDEVQILEPETNINFSENKDDNGIKDEINVIKKENYVKVESTIDTYKRKDRFEYIGKFICDFCGTDFTQNKSLKYHIENSCRSIFPEKIKTRDCLFCLKTYSNYGNCRTHMETCKKNPNREVKDKKI